MEGWSYGQDTLKCSKAFICLQWEILVRCSVAAASFPPAQRQLPSTHKTAFLHCRLPCYCYPVLQDFRELLPKRWQLGWAAIIQNSSHWKKHALYHKKPCQWINATCPLHSHSQFTIPHTAFMMKPNRAATLTWVPKTCFKTQNRLFCVKKKSVHLTATMKWAEENSSG